MLREISAKSGIFSKRREILLFFRIFPRNMLCSTYLSPSAPLASQFARLWRSFDAPCGARIIIILYYANTGSTQIQWTQTTKIQNNQLCAFVSRLRCVDLSYTTFRNVPAPLPPVKFIHIRVISTNISSISRLSTNITETSISDGDWEVKCKLDITVNRTVGIRAECRL